MNLPHPQAMLVSRGKVRYAVLPAKGRTPHGVEWLRGEWLDDRMRLKRTDTLCQIAIVEVERFELHTLDDKQAIRAGFRGRGVLARWWRERYDGVPQPASESPWPAERPQPVRVVELSLDVPVWLGRQSGYTTNPKLGVVKAGECVPADTAKWLSEEAEARDELLRLGKQRRVQAGKLEELYAEAEEHGVDVSRQAASIQRQLDAMDRKLRRRAA